MTASGLLYGLVIAGFLAAAAHFLDRGLRAVQRPTRWIWLSALAVGVGAPFVPQFLPAPVPGPGAPATSLSLQDLYALAGAEHPLTSGRVFSLVSLDRPLVLLWIFTSVALVLLLVWAGLWLHGQKRGWPGRKLWGEEILVSGGLGPAVIGFLRPRIVLPEWAFSLEEERLALVLLHEREHRKARDPALLATGTLLVLACPLNPALWWMLRRLRLAVEGDCDARVLATGVHRKRYGRLLLDVAERAGRSLNLAPALVEKRGTHLERRLEMIRQGGKNHKWLSSILASVAGVLFLALACETPTPPNQAEEEEGPVDAFVAQEAAEAGVPAEGEGYARIRIHGTSPAGGGEPIYFVDDVRMDAGFNQSRDLAASDIARIEVVKGKAAVAQFGPEAVNGVIKIFTKTGVGDEPGDGESSAREVAKGQYEFQDGRVGIKEVAEGQDRLIPLAEGTGDRVLSPEDEATESGSGIVKFSAGSAAERGEPLVLIDGVVAEGPDWKNAISPDQIDRIEVIKGAAAETLYGAKGANGVILITLKK